jgi:hypothetical protein
LGSFCAFHSPADQDATVAIAHIPQSTQVWLCFAPFVPGTRPRRELGLLCAFTLRPDQIWFVSHVSLRGPGHGPRDSLCPYAPVHPSLALFCAFRGRRPPAAGEIGFVSHSSALRRLGVHARLPPPAAEIGFVSHDRLGGGEAGRTAGDGRTRWLSPTQRRRTLASTSLPRPVFRHLRHSLFEFVSDFVFRISDFPPRGRANHR